MRMRVVAAVAASLITAMAAVAQQPSAAPRRPRAMRAQMEQGAPGRRQELQRRIHQAFAQAMREKVGLSNDQMRRLAPVNRKYAQQRRALLQQERDVRQALRRAITDTASVDQAKIGDYQQQLIDLQRRRLDLIQAEQRDLSSFMTPLQLAKYRALQEQVRRRVEQFRMQMQRERRGPPRQRADPSRDSSARSPSLRR